MKKVLMACAAMLFMLTARADEGMWLLPYLSKLNVKDMRAEGLKLKAEDIYSVNENSLKDAIVIFGGGCTGEVVSAEGLLLTNHHCGYGQIQALSTVENDFLKNGFWAMSRAEEIPAPGLSVTFIRRMEEVTDEILGEAADMGIGDERSAIILANLSRVSQELNERYSEYEVEVVPFMGGNQFFAVVSERYTDVRLVGTPPNSMGKFGGDTDNWMWPRHTDDFSMFRIYAGPDNRPADYSPENRPYEAPVHLKISLKGVKENDFAMIMGFPGSTDRYMTTYEMKRLMEEENASRISVRGERLAIIMEDMLADNEVRLKYAAKYASSSNYWKNAIGKNKSLVDNKIPELKAALEARFQAWAEGADRVDSPMQYRLALPKIREAVEETSGLTSVYTYLVEALYSGTEIVAFTRLINSLMESDADEKEKKAAIMTAAAGFYKNDNEPTDRRVAKRMFALVREKVPAEYLPSIYEEIDSQLGGDTDAFIDNLYDTSIFSSEARLSVALDNYDPAKIKEDPAFRTSSSVFSEIDQLRREKLLPNVATLYEWNGIYIKGLTEMEPGKKFYPDANFTMRLTYGQVLPYDPRDGVTYKYYTTLKGVLEKEDPTNPLEFTVPDQLKTAYATSDYGRYGQNGELRLNFLTNNDITGGNSGSPVLNARGELIGLAFDGNWEAMSGDVVFEPSLQRCINVDIRYVLWTIDRFAGAGHLLREMTIIQ